MKTKEELTEAFLEAKKQVDFFTDKMLQAKEDFKVNHSKFKVGEVVKTNLVPSRIVIVESICTKYERGELRCHYTLRKVKSDNTPSQHLYNRHFTIDESKLLKFE